MNKINLNDINLQAFKKTKYQGPNSTVYENKDICIKILNGLYPNEKEILYNKFIDMENIKIDGVLLPIDLIMKDNTLYGYTMHNFKNSTTLNIFFTRNRFTNCSDIFKAIKKASIILKNIHNNGIIYKDLSFDNILIDKNDNIMFSDIDSCCYKNYNSPFTSYLLMNFINNYRKESINISENLDRISMIISMFYLIYQKEIQKISQKEYNFLSNFLNTLENSKIYINALLNKNEPIPTIPYLDELIDDYDDYIIDRNKQIPFKRLVLNIMEYYK